MKTLKLIISQAMIISVGIVLVMGIEGIIYHCYNDDITLKWYHPISILIAGILCAIPSLIWTDMEKLSRKQFIIRTILHCILVYGIVVLMGFIFKWYANLEGYLVLTGLYFVVYVFTWAMSRWMFKKEDKEINEALKNIQDEE